MNTPITYTYEITLRQLKEMLDTSNLSVVKLKPEFPNQKSFDIFENGNRIYNVLFTGRVDEWKITMFTKNNPLVADIMMQGCSVKLYRATNLAGNNEYKLLYGMLREPLGIVWALHYWGYLK